MKIPKAGKLLLGTVFVLLSVLVIAQIGDFCNVQTQEDEEDSLLKGYRLSTELNFEEAYSSFRLAWLMATTVENNEEKALEALKRMGNCAFWMGEVDSCIYRCQQAAELACKLNKPYDEFEILAQLKQTYMAKVDMKNVLLITQKIDSLVSCSTDVRIKIGLNQELAIEAIQTQNPQLAEHYWLKNITLLDSLAPNERQSAQFVVYGNLRDFYFNMQEFDKAKKYSHLYIEAGKRNITQRQFGYMMYDGEALICAQQKDQKAAFEALDSMKYGLTLIKDASQVNVMHYHNVAGRVYAILGEWGKACKEYRKALDAVDGTLATGRMDYFRIVQSLGTSLCQSKKYDEARACYSEVAQYSKYQYGEESLAYADILAALANIEVQCGKNSAGKQYIATSVDICKKLVAGKLTYISVQERNAFWLKFAPKMWSMTAYAHKTGEQQSPFTEKCYEALLFSKALLLESDRTMTTAIRNKCSQDEQRIYYEMQNLQSLLKAQMNDYEKNKNSIEELHQKISKQNKRLTPIISKLGYTSFLSQNYSDIKNVLSDDEVLLDFTDFMTEEQLHQHSVFVIGHKQEYPKLNMVFTEQEMKLLLRGKPTDFLYKEPYASKAIRMIWEPLANDVKGKKTIYYVPSGILHRIALESIPTKDGSLLGSHYRFIRLSSAREIAKMKKNEQNHLHTTATIYGALEYDMEPVIMSQEASRYKKEPLLALNDGKIIRGEGRFRKLPNTKEEIEIIEKILKKSHLTVTVQKGTKGTEESFLALSGKAPNILHVATHGFYYTPDKAKDIPYLNGYNDAMQLSGLIMSGGNSAWTGKQIPKGALGGVLTANSIANMDLRGTDLVVLSACQTGRGVSTPEGLYGLQRAFKKAGVQTLVMTLWSVNDESTKDFMTKFYEELVDTRNKWDKRKAFEKAKEYIRSNPRYKNDPYYWACFVMLD